jgi:hypothetical protein
MTLGDKDNVRAISAWPTDEEVPDAEIDEALASATRKIVTMTGVEDAQWDVAPTSVNKPLANETAEFCAAANIILRVSNVDKVVERRNELQEACQNSMNLLIQALGATESDNPAFVDVTSEYTTWPLNPNVSAYDPLLSDYNDP